VIFLITLAVALPTIELALFADEWLPDNRLFYDTLDFPAIYDLVKSKDLLNFFSDLLSSDESLCSASF
jgi:hypothetical protein